MNIAVIGANGFIGSRVVEMLYLEGLHEVTSIVRKPASLALPGRFTMGWRLGDALDTGSLSEALCGCDAVIHAAIGDPRQIEQMPSIFCAAAAAAGIKRVVYLSSASVHGQNPQIGTDEKSYLTRNHSIEYNNAKVRAENSFFVEMKKYGLEGYALRPGVVYGPRSRWISDLATDLFGGRAWLAEGGQGIFNGIYVDNLVSAIVRCLTVDRGAGESYLVGDAETITWAEFYRISANFFGIPFDAIRHIERVPEFRKSLRERIGDLVNRPLVQSILPAFPGDLKRATKAVIASWSPSNIAEAWSEPASRPSLRITEEMALLQCCRWKFPHTKATKNIGYQPQVSFVEGMHRSLAWWNFASGRNV
jgi:2-alkyl-3-oxoalkanoate reductase